MVQTEKLARLRAARKEKGDLPCDHPTVDKEYYLGADTGDEACLVCGQTWPRGHRPAPSPSP